MYAVEFVTSIKNGIVHVPSQYKDLQQKNSAKIVIMVDEIKNDILPADNMNTHIDASDNLDQFFDNFQIDMTGYKFDRDEANER